MNFTTTYAAAYYGYGRLLSMASALLILCSELTETRMKLSNVLLTMISAYALFVIFSYTYFL